MSADGPLFGVDRIRDLLIELGRRLDERGIEARLFVVGGAAMALAYGRDRVTRDIDAVFVPKTEVYAEAARMARDLGIPEDWLNDGVEGLMPDRAQPVEGSTSFTTAGLHVGVASAEYLYAMKAQAARQEADADDLRHLVDLLGLRSVDEALDLVEHFYDPVRLRANTKLLLEDIIGEKLAGDR